MNFPHSTNSMSELRRKNRHDFWHGIGIIFVLTFLCVFLGATCDRRESYMSGAAMEAKR